MLSDACGQNTNTQSDIQRHRSTEVCGMTFAPKKHTNQTRSPQFRYSPGCLVTMNVWTNTSWGENEFSVLITDPSQSSLLIFRGGVSTKQSLWLLVMETPPGKKKKQDNGKKTTMNEDGINGISYQKITKVIFQLVMLVFRAVPSIPPTHPWTPRLGHDASSNLLSHPRYRPRAGMPSWGPNALRNDRKEMGFPGVKWGPLKKKSGVKRYPTSNFFWGCQKITPKIPSRIFKRRMIHWSDHPDW